MRLTLGYAIEENHGTPEEVYREMVEEEQIVNSDIEFVNYIAFNQLMRLYADRVEGHKDGYFLSRPQLFAMLRELTYILDTQKLPSYLEEHSNLNRGDLFEELEDAFLAVSRHMQFADSILFIIFKSV